MKLVFPLLEHEAAALDYRREHFGAGERVIHGDGGLDNATDYGEWIAKITSAQTAAQTGWVNCSTYFAFVNDKIVGTIQICHTLNERLLKSEGHIGYGIRPSERGKGYGKEMLRLALEKCGELGIDRALVTCDKDNLASAATAKSCGGILENEIIEEDGNILQRYWLKPPEYWDLYDINRKKLGRFHRRGDPIPEGCYHVVVNIWIMNSRGELLLQERHPQKPIFGGMWQCAASGSITAGETSLEGAVRETKEEIGVDMPPSEAVLIETLVRQSDFRDTYLYVKDIDIDGLVFQPEEVSGAKWADKDEYTAMCQRGEVAPPTNNFYEIYERFRVF